MFKFKKEPVTFEQLLPVLNEKKRKHFEVNQDEVELPRSSKKLCKNKEDCQEEQGLTFEELAYLFSQDFKPRKLLSLKEQPRDPLPSDAVDLPILCLKDAEFHLMQCICIRVSSSLQCDICNNKRRVGPSELFSIFKYFLQPKSEEFDQVIIFIIIRII